MTEQELKVLCTTIRGVFDKWSEDGTLRAILGSSGDSFPTGCCGSTTEVMAIVLNEITGEFPHQIRGESNENDNHHKKLSARSHLWLELNGITIDLTGDQFNNEFINIPSVLVTASAHPLSKLMRTKKTDAYIIGVTKPVGSFDLPQYKLAHKVLAEIKPKSSKPNP